MTANQNRSFLDECRDSKLLEVLKQRCLAFFQSDAALQPEESVDEDAVPLCANCLAPQEQETHFCPKCGAPTGQYTNVMPYEHILSMGWGLREGINPENKLNSFKSSGYFLAAIAQYGILAPLYWYRMYRSRKSNGHDKV